MASTPMIKATGKPGKLELTANGAPVTSLRDDEMSFQLGEKIFTITRKGVVGPKFELWSGNNLTVSLKQIPFLNRYSVTYAGQVWTLKAMGFTEKNYRLYRDAEQVGSVSTSYFSPYKEILIDLPDELPMEAQAFVMWLILRNWSDTSSG
jgi:hypothetical protein